MTVQNNDRSIEGEYAGFISRVMALVIDIVLTNGVVLVVGIGTNWVIDFFTLGGRLGQGDHVTDVGQAVLTVVVVFMALLMNVGYYVALWMLTGRTLGKGVMGLKVVHVRGRSISFGIALRRLIGYYCSAIVLFLGFIWVLVDDDRRGWHDKMAGTCVIYASETDGSGSVRSRRRERISSASR
jgi:uncharacterized RDD family membrane protein YckC